ncbi:hypothetical protein VPH35_077280 [Triticum aestivum]
MFRSETLLWINLLNRSSTPFSTSPMLRSSACNCSSSQTTLLFWTRDHLLPLVVANCFGNSCDVDSSRETDISLASASSLISLQSSPLALLLAIFLKGFCACLARRMKDSTLS